MARVAQALEEVGLDAAKIGSANGQVTYNGHPLYTFASDDAGQVTGQGVQNFFVATPGLSPLTTSSAGTAPAARPTVR